MTDGIEGVGEAVTGGMIARAVEPGAGEAGEAGERNCLNCGAALDGPYCRQCGQKAHVHRSVGAIATTRPRHPPSRRQVLAHLADAGLAAGRADPPLRPWRAGEVRLADGDVPVLRLPDVRGAVDLRPVAVEPRQLTTAQLQHGMEEARTEMASDLDRARQNRVRIAAGRGAALPRPARDAGADRRQDRRDGARPGRVRSGCRARTARLSLGGRGATITNLTGWARLDYGLQKFNENPSLALYKLQSNGYKFSWLLIPLSVPFVWLMFFWTRRFHFYDHTVFVTYSIAFMSLFAILLTVLGFAGVPSAIIALAAVFIPPIHMFRQLKGAYQLHWASALLRTFLLVNFCFVTATLFFVLLLGLGALG